MCQLHVIHAWTIFVTATQMDSFRTKDVVYIFWYVPTLKPALRLLHQSQKYGFFFKTWWLLVMGWIMVKSRLFCQEYAFVFQACSQSITTMVSQGRFHCTLSYLPVDFPRYDSSAVISVCLLPAIHIIQENFIQLQHSNILTPKL